MIHDGALNFRIMKLLLLIGVCLAISDCDRSSDSRAMVAGQQSGQSTKQKSKVYDASLFADAESEGVLFSCGEASSAKGVWICKNSQKRRV